MTFEQVPPSNRLVQRRRFSKRVCAGDWMKLHCGDVVFAIDDPRHLGRVEAIFNSAVVLVRWHDNDWLEEVHIENLSRMEK